MKAAAGLSAETSEVRLRSSDGSTVPLPVERWLARSGPEELAVLHRAQPPVLDVGCGPGRHVLALARRGVLALGIDTAPTAVRLGRSRGATILERSIFQRVPCPGRWGTALLLDGSVGIGGDPVRLLRRVRSLLRPDGTVLIELDPEVRGIRRLRARVENGACPGPWFSWSRVGVEATEAVAREAGLRSDGGWNEGGRWFAELTKA